MAYVALLLTIVACNGGSVHVATEEEAAAADVYYFRKCVAALPSKHYPVARTAQERTNARRRAILLLAYEADCASHSGVGGLTPADLTRRSGFLFTPANERFLVDPK